MLKQPCKVCCKVCGNFSTFPELQKDVSKVQQHCIVKSLLQDTDSRTLLAWKTSIYDNNKLTEIERLQ